LNKLYIFLGILVVIAFSLIYYLFNPELYSFFPECPFHKFLGLDCPGCGSQRAIHSLLNGDIPAAADYNLLLVASLPFLLVHFRYKAVSFFTGKESRWKVIDSPLTPKVIVALVLVFWIVRNVPLKPFSYLAA
jgi:hypothetical protein